MSVNSRGLKNKLAKLEDIRDSVMPKALSTFVRNTPRRSGRARRNTRLNNQKEIVANYAYAERLDQGWSQQSPQGMTKPTIIQIRKLVKEFVKKLGA